MTGGGAASTRAFVLITLRTRHNGGVTDTQSEVSDAERADRLEKLQGIMDLMRPAVQAGGVISSW